jgi:hypothetical protein
MRKLVVITLVAAVTTVVPWVETAAAAEPQSPAASPVGSVRAQESGRRGDRRLFESSQSQPVIVAGPADRFDLRDAGIGAGVAFALALLIAAALVLRSSSRKETSAQSLAS